MNPHYSWRFVAKSPESAFLVTHISFKRFEFHVSGFKLFVSDY